MNHEDYLKPLAHCNLCEHHCGVNRLYGETGICRMTMPAVASATLHPATPDVEPMDGIAQPARLIGRVRSNVIRHRYDNPNRNTAF